MRCLRLDSYVRLSDKVTRKFLCSLKGLQFYTQQAEDEGQTKAAIFVRLCDLIVL